MFAREVVGLIMDVVFLASAVGAVGCLVVGWKGEWRTGARKERQQAAVFTLIVCVLSVGCIVRFVDDLNLRLALRVGATYEVVKVVPVNQKHDIVSLVSNVGGKDRTFIFRHGSVRASDIVDMEVYYANKL